MVYAGSSLSWMGRLGSLVYIVCRRQATEKGDENITEGVQKKNVASKMVKLIVGTNGN